MFMYSNRIVTDINTKLPVDEKIPANISTVVIGFFAFLGTIGSFFVVKQNPRRRVYLFGQFGVALCLGALSLFIYLEKGYLAIGSILVYELVINSTIGAIHWLYLPEVLSDIQFGFVATVHYLNGVEVALTTEWFIKLLSPTGTFFFYTIVTFLGFIFFFFYIKETQGLADW